MYTLSSLVKVVNPTRAAQPPHNTMKFLIKFNSIGKPILDADERAAQALAPRAQIFWIKNTKIISKRSQVPGSTFRVGDKDKIEDPKSSQKCWFCHIIANAPPTFRLGMTKPGVSHINTPPKWSPGTGT